MGKLTLTRLPKVVISIVGNGDTGKSRLLREFAQKLAWDDPKSVVYGLKCADWRTKKENDFRVGGLFHGVKVAIMTGGDDADTIIRAFIYAQKWESDILVVATRPALSPNGISISWVAIEAVTAAYSIKWIRIDKREATDADRVSASGELERKLADTIVGLK